MSTMKYTEDHEWVRVEDDGSVVVGITDFAQQQLGELVFVELPAVGDEIEQGADAAVIESVKAASELRSPLSGTVTAVNGLLSDEPGKVNEAPESDGWFYRLTPGDSSELDGLMDEASYRATLD